MSYWPKSKIARRFVESLRVWPPADASLVDRLLDSQDPAYNLSNLREVMLTITCPIVCVGEIRGEKWHEVCEARVDRALNELTGH